MIINANATGVRVLFNHIKLLEYLGDIQPICCNGYRIWGFRPGSTLVLESKLINIYLNFS